MSCSEQSCTTNISTPGLHNLPVELLYEISLFSSGGTLPCLNKRLHSVFAATSSSFRAEYLFTRILSARPLPRDPITRLLRYPLCTREVLDAMFRFPETFEALVAMNPHEVPSLPRRLFKSLSPKAQIPGQAVSWTVEDAPLPFLRYLYSSPHVPHLPDPNAHDGYALTKSIYASHLPLTHFLLACGASPKHKDGLALKVAIRRKDLDLVRLLVEPEALRNDAEAIMGMKRKRSEEELSNIKRGAAKRRRIEDRIEVNKDFLKEAVRANARDIVEYFVREKNLAPDMNTLHIMDGYHP